MLSLHDASAIQSKKVFNKKTAITAAIVTGSIATMFAIAPATHALENFNLGTGISNQDEDQSQSAGLRVAGDDDLENVGAGTVLHNQDGEESQSLTTGLESTDNLENVGGALDAENKDGEEAQSLSTGIQSEDNLEDVSTHAQGMTRDEDSASQYGVSFSFDE
jgi:hypothetical protein